MPNQLPPVGRGSEKERAAGQPITGPIPTDRWSHSRGRPRADRARPHSTRVRDSIRNAKLACFVAQRRYQWFAPEGEDATQGRVDGITTILGRDHCGSRRSSDIAQAACWRSGPVHRPLFRVQIGETGNTRVGKLAHAGFLSSGRFVSTTRPNISWGWYARRETASRPSSTSHEVSTKIRETVLSTLPKCRVFQIPGRVHLAPSVDP